MQRFGKVLRLRPGAAAEYERYHAAVWPEVLAAISRAGIQHYSIYRYDDWLFSYFELPDGVSAEEAGAQIAANETCQRWEELMHTLQAPLPESTGDNWWVPMPEIFHHD